MSCVRQQEVRYEELKASCVEVAKYRSKLSVDTLWVRLRGIKQRSGQRAGK